MKRLLSTVRVYFPGGTRCVLLGSVWFHEPVPDTVALAASCANPSAGQFTTWAPGQTLWCREFSIWKPTEPQGPAVKVVEVGPGATPA